MRRLVLAIGAFFRILFNAEMAADVQRLFDGDGAAGADSAADRPARRKEPASLAPKQPARSEALTLLATLQREARFVDFIMEPLEGYADAQIGAVARDVHRDCGKTLQRLFALEPVLSQQEGTDVDVPAGFDPGHYHLTGNVVGEPPFRGQLAHHGWTAKLCELPAWSGREASASIVAPVEVELK